jgi:hypothetical protein
MLDRTGRGLCISCGGRLGAAKGVYKNCARCRARNRERVRLLRVGRESRVTS